LSASLRTFDAYLFDLDGTLIDSIELIFRSYEHTFREHRMPVIDRARILAHLGRTLTDSFGDFASDASAIPDLVATYREFNLAHHDALVKPYAGAHELVDVLRASGRKVGIVTSKKRETARRGLAVCGFDVAFDVFVGMEDSARHKPDPEPLERALERLCMQPADACYVGDSPHDAAAGNAAGVHFFAAGWGPFARAHFATVSIAGWLEHPRELLERALSQPVRE